MDDQVVWTALNNHFGGDVHNSKQSNLDISELETLAYKNERQFSFRKFLKELKRVDTIISKKGYNYLGKTKYDNLLKSIQVQNCNHELSVIIESIGQNYRDNFDGACTYLATIIVQVFPLTKKNRKNNGN